MSIKFLESLFNPVATNVSHTKSKELNVRIVKAKDPSVNGSFDEPVRKGRKPEVSKNHPAVLECRKLCLEGKDLTRVSIEVGVEYSILARWYDKGWMNPPKTKRKDKLKQIV